MSDFKIRIEEPKLLSEDIAESIKTAIIKGKFKPGEKISEGELAESMGISRTPLREAFRKLENEGFIRIIPRKGAVVTPIDADETYHLYEIKSTLEGLAARLAVVNMQEKDLDKLVRINGELRELIDKNDLEAFYKAHTRFHEVFVKLSGNQRLIQIIYNLNDHFKRFGIVSLTLPGQYDNAIRQHEEIIEAFRQGDDKLVEERVKSNVMTGGQVLIDHLCEVESSKEK
ncbi:MAG: GntR family transcriptional regulator [bacterium]|nr:GntR family transcriptional regulator [bacterium]MDT8395185.1 GntR family transcriptional regulator [bacterium]